MRLFVTGGAGFLGRAIARSLEGPLWREAELFPDGMTVYSRDEAKQFTMSQEFPDLTYVLGDIRNREHLAAAMAGHDVVIHAAAIKFIPEAERNVLETISVNVDGSLSVLAAARVNRIQTLIGVSTDKACAPLNTYGMTKALMERAFQTGLPSTRVGVVRYGNVIGSTGSVVPVFLDQLGKFDHVRVTDPEMTRFWMTADDAVRAILHALADTRDRIVYVPKARAATMETIAQAVNEFSGHGPRHGFDRMPVRPAEKLHETLVTEAESLRCHGSPTQSSTAKYMHILPASQDAPYSDSWTFTSEDADRIGPLNLIHELTKLRDWGEL